MNQKKFIAFSFVLSMFNAFSSDSERKFKTLSSSPECLEREHFSLPPSYSGLKLGELLIAL
jgi:hypothetical protein